MVVFIWSGVSTTTICLIVMITYTKRVSSIMACEVAKLAHHGHAT